MIALHTGIAIVAIILLIIKVKVDPIIALILGCLYLFWSLPQRTQLWFLVWNAVGFVVYLAYSRRNNVLAKGGDA